MDETMIGVLRSEATEMLALNRACLATADRLMAIAGSLVAAAFAASSAIEAMWPFAVLPLVVPLILAYQFHVYADAKAALAYRVHLERLVDAALLHGNVLVYGRAIAPERSSKRDPSLAFGQALWMVFVVASLVPGFFGAVQLSESLAQGGQTLALGVYGAASLASFGVAWLARKSGDRVKRNVELALISTFALKPPPVPGP